VKRVTDYFSVDNLGFTTSVFGFPSEKRFNWLTDIFQVDSLYILAYLLAEFDPASLERS